MTLAPDPADTALDAAADGNFGGKATTNRRAGYGDKIDMVLRMARKGGCLAAGEGQMLVEHYEERLTAVEAERDTLSRILAALREPSETVLDAAFVHFYPGCFPEERTDILTWSILAPIRAAVAAAEKEVQS